MNTEGIIRAVQAELKRSIPSLVVDGKAGPETWGAIAMSILPKQQAAPVVIAADSERADARSERFIKTLLPPVRSMARALLSETKRRGFDCRIISGTRTAEEQDALYAQGRTKPGPKVTNARAGYSNHNFGIAFDVGIFEGKRYLEESPLYKVAGSIGIALGLEWGGNWKTIVDEPHFQLRPAWAKSMSEREMLAEFRAGREFHE